MKNQCLIISFDLINFKEETTSYAIGSLLSFLKSKPEYNNQYLVENYAFNLLPNSITEEQILKSNLFEKEIFNYTHIALSAYVWSANLTHFLMQNLRQKGFIGKFILGGYEISYSNKFELVQEYPLADYFIIGYAEKALYNILCNKYANQKIISEKVDFLELESPYLWETIPIPNNLKKLRWETKRGCPYKCNFCAHRDLENKRVYKHSLDKIFQELTLFKEKKVQKLNVLDPVFNIGNDSIEILKEAKKIGLNTLLSLQSRPERLTDEFLDICMDLNVELEFGIQTMVQAENDIIKRENDYEKIYKNLQKTIDRNIPFEISLIYGLPLQTYNSFMYSINTLQEMGVDKITAFPLMLLKGTELYDTRKNFNYREEKLGIFNIPTVVESNTFSNNEWLKMHEVAANLMANERVM